MFVCSAHSLKIFIQCCPQRVGILFSVFFSWELCVLGLIRDIDDFYVVQRPVMSRMLPFQQNDNMNLFLFDFMSPFMQFSRYSKALVSKLTLFIQVE